MDLELLRTFIAVLETGGFAKAGARRHVTQSTVSQQMQRLAEQAGHPLFTPLGRRRVPTPSAELLFGYAQRLIGLHDEATRALADGSHELVRIGSSQDFADARLPDALRAFRRTHAGVRLEVRVGRSVELARMVESGALDLAIVFGTAGSGLTAPFGRERMAWLAGPGFVPPRPGEPWPLALFEAPCVFREAALEALASAGLPYQLAYSTPSLSGLLAAVRAGLAVTLRLARHGQKGLHALGAREGLPAVGHARLSLVTADRLGAAGQALAAVLRANARRR